MLEPSLIHYPNAGGRYFAATRPQFLLATVLAYALGVVTALYAGLAMHLAYALTGLGLALLVHAGVNLLNDYYDALNGTDDLNTERLYPYTGGSRFIQNGVLSTAQVAGFAYLLLAIVTLAGLYLSYVLGLGLLALGLFGVGLAWAYSAPPWRLNSRGLGEFCVLLGFLGVSLGAYYLQASAYSWQVVIIAMPYALLVTNLLYINQFPDCKADSLAGKRHWVVRLPFKLARLVYPMLASLACAWLVYFIYLGALPQSAMWSALPILLSARASYLLGLAQDKPANLLVAIKLTLAAMLGHGLLLVLVLIKELQ
jgi:1,4-dihydroxy-2-naphthoate octaprenyltransferase